MTIVGYIISTEKGYIGIDEQSGGYPYLTQNPLFAKVYKNSDATLGEFDIESLKVKSVQTKTLFIK